MLAVLYMFTNIFQKELFNILKEQFSIKNCPGNQIEGEDGNCTCPLVGQVYSTQTNKCMCSIGKTEKIINSRPKCV